MKQFEVPVYALSKEKLNKKYYQCPQKIRTEHDIPCLRTNGQIKSNHHYNIPAQINNKLQKRKQADAQAPLVSFLYTAILHLPQRAICKSFLLNFTYFTESA